VYELHLSQLSKVAMPINSKIAYCILFSKNYRCPPRYSESEDHYVLGIYPNSVHRFLVSNGVTVFRPALNVCSQKHIFFLPR